MSRVIATSENDEYPALWRHEPPELAQHSDAIARIDTIAHGKLWQSQ